MPAGSPEDYPDCLSQELKPYEPRYNGELDVVAGAEYLTGHADQYRIPSKSTVQKLLDVFSTFVITKATWDQDVICVSSMMWCQAVVIPHG
jgi:hypothetical protein